MKIQARIGIALLGAVCLAGLTTARADEFSDRIGKAIATLNQIDKHIDSLHSGSAGAAAPVSAPSRQVAIAATTLKCAACGMEMPTKRANRNQRAVKIGGKTYFCCRGCDMSKIIDK